MRSHLARALVAVIAAAGCVTAASPAHAAGRVVASKTCYDIWLFLLTPGQPITICL